MEAVLRRESLGVLGFTLAGARKLAALRLLAPLVQLVPFQRLLLSATRMMCAAGAAMTNLWVASFAHALI